MFSALILPFSAIVGVCKGWRSQFKNQTMQIVTNFTYLPEGWEGGSHELQAWQPDCSTGESHLECHHMAFAGQPGHQAQPIPGFRTGR